VNEAGTQAGIGTEIRTGIETASPQRTICEGLLGQIGDERIVLMGLLMETHAKLTRVLSAELEAECGLPLIWFDVLLRLGRSPDGRLTMSNLAAQVSLTTGGMTRLVDRITEAGLVERQNCSSDRRSVHVALTEAGMKKLEEATRIHLEGLERHLLEPLDAAERMALAGALGKLRGRA
jgi:DNA-binding MarR family transcriptional regulator